MMATFWFLIKTILAICFLAFLIGIGGRVTIDVAAYSLSTSLGLFIILMLGIMWFTSITLRMISLMRSAPQIIARRREIKAYQKGLRAVAEGMSAIAAGDVKAARQATKTLIRRLKHEDYGLSDLMAALTARLQGDETQMRRSCHAMMLKPETSFIGMKGLLQSAIDKRDNRYALLLAEKAYARHPRNDWVVNALFDLQVLNGHFTQAESLLPKLARAKGLTPWETPKYRAALLYEAGLPDKAYKVDASFLPAAMHMLSVWTGEGKIRKAKKVIQALWAQAPHPELMDYWVRCAPKKAMSNKPAMVAWVEDLQRMRPDNAAAALYAGEVLYHMGQADQAKRFIKQALDIKPTQDAARLMAQIDGDHSIQSSSQGQSWVCTKTGRHYPQWRIATDEGHVMTLIWDYPDRVTVQDHRQSSLSLLVA